MNNVDKYVNMLQTHDWYYDYSDDHTQWQKGLEEMAKIREAYKALEPELAKALWNQYAPVMFKMR